MKLTDKLTLATISSKDKNSSFFLLGLLAIKSISQKYLFKFICWRVKKDQVKTALSHNTLSTQIVCCLLLEQC